MGSALLRRFAANKLAASLRVIKPTPLAPDLHPLAEWHSGIDGLPVGYTPDIVVLAVKPQVMPDVIPVYARYSGALFLSIAAGVRLFQLRHMLQGAALLVRAMPNLPSAIGQGMTTVVTDASLPALHHAWTQDLMESLGRALWVTTEDDMDKAGVVAGCGPAFVFAVTEALEQAALSLGLAPDVAALLARQTMVGSGAQLAASDVTPALLREAVTSKGGSTAAGLTVLMRDVGAGEGALQNLFRLTTEASLRRTKELAGGKP